MIHAPLFDKHDPTTTVSTQWMSIYEGRLNHGSKKSIPYFEGKNNPREAYIGIVQHILARKSRKREQKKQDDSMLSMHSHDMLHNTESLPKDASQHHVA